MHFSPKLVTDAGCISVRASTGSPAWLAASVCKAATARCVSRSIRLSARCVTSASAVSITSWLVLATWVCGTAAGSTRPTASFSALISGIATLPARELSASSCGTSKASTRQQLRMVCAAAAGINPTLACALARAASNCSMAATKSRSFSTPSMSGVDKKLSNTRLMGQTPSLDGLGV